MSNLIQTPSIHTSTSNEYCESFQFSMPEISESASPAPRRKSRLALKRPKYMKIAKFKSEDFDKTSLNPTLPIFKRSRFVSESICQDEYLFVNPKKTRHSKENALNAYLDIENVRQIHLSVAMKEVRQ
mmetsp:Transcript_14700/g.16418  ORF Transcript_14700/g.16418 Transcript_14700/m.16418 type:complete len:128 (-) Transcript_14700:51-434(-)